ncbi:hypothetical protein [Agrococcus beijingensis]|uniref:hypothetical protein n=1 Tax=Agrococcus beijingensis TaxID=3068634 RepID=UPI002741B3DC|nr:hypothetical protein [Agrococcus sp. REN33]
MSWMRCAALVILLAAGAAGCTATPPEPTESPPASTPTEQSPAPTAAPAEPAPTPTPTPSILGTPVGEAVDARAWIRYSSEIHDVDLAHPPGWTVVPAEREWSMAEDAGAIESPGQDGFMSAAGDVWITLWSVPYSGGETLEGVQTWAEELCLQIGDPSCATIGERAEPLCLERRDCHPGLLVPFEFDVHAYVTGGDHASRIVTLAVWRASSFPVRGMGSAREVLEAFLETMDVWPAG